MKYTMLLISFFMSCLISQGELSEKQLKDAKKLVSIDAVRNSVENDTDGTSLLVQVEFSSEKRGLNEVLFRVAIELTDREKKTYLLAALSKKIGILSETYLGEGYWELKIPYGDMGRLKVTGYAAEFGLMDGEKFVPFDGKYKTVKTYEELTGRTTTPFPVGIKLAPHFENDDN
ncbi:MAG: hypothetical protein PHP93_07855 [Kiritimatiellales bacterium]|nr:hypothetical protein [Kiritimatiellales bacterium]